MMYGAAAQHVASSPYPSHQLVVADAQASAPSPCAAVEPASEARCDDACRQRQQVLQASAGVRWVLHHLLCSVYKSRPVECLSIAEGDLGYEAIAIKGMCYARALNVDIAWTIPACTAGQRCCWALWDKHDAVGCAEHHMQVLLCCCMHHSYVQRGAF
jgi:hypothetical protein